MFKIKESLSEEPALDWLNQFVESKCLVIVKGKEDILDECVKRALYEALFVRLSTIAQTSILEECNSKEILDSKYPLLRRRLELSTDNFEFAVKEMLDRIILNRVDISDAFLDGNRFNRIIGISFSGADTHNRGRSTCRITTDSGVFIYKPHDVRQDKFVAELVERFFQDTIRVPRCLEYIDKESERYGFCEYIANLPAKNETSAAHYYYNLGGLAAITQLLGSIDMHYENILSAGEYPIPVDLETFFRPQFNKTFRKNTVNTSISNDFEHSVIFNGMFPARINGELEISSMLSMNEANASMPIVDNVRHSIYNYIDDYYAGFKKVYLAGLKDKEEIREYLDAAPDFQVRVVLRPTNYYGKVQYAISNAEHLANIDVISDTLEKRLCFNPHGIEAPEWRKVIAAEKSSILNEDIPYFFTRFRSLDIYDNEGLVASNVFGKSAKEVAEERLERLSDRELEFEICIQKQMIEQALVPVKEAFPKASYIETSKSHNSSQVVDRIIANSIVTPSGGRCWFTTLPSSGRRLLNFGYYRGKLGIALILEMYRKLHSETKYGDAIIEFSNRCRGEIIDYASYLDSRDELLYPEFNINLENGCAGWIEALMRLYKTTDDVRFLEAARKCHKLIEKYQIPDVKDVSRRNGEAGVIEILCKYHDELAVDDKLIRNFADHLIDRKTAIIDGKALWYSIGRRRAVSGMDCGMAGIGKSLHMAGNLFSEEKYRKAACDAFEFERNIYDESKGGWRDMFKSTVSPEKYGGFSSGNAGLGFLWLYLDDEVMLDKAVSSVISAEPVFSDRLRDGNLGTIDFLIEAGARLKRPDIVETASEKLSEIITRQLHYVDRQYHQIYEPTLFAGDGGLLYILMRLENPQEIESLLM